MDLEEAEQPKFKDMFQDLENIHLKSQGGLLSLYYEYRYKNFGFSTFARRWEYPWAIINADIKNGDRILDAGCGCSPLLLYLYKKGCICYGLDNKFSYEINPLSFCTRKNKIAQKLSRHYPFYFWINPHGTEGLCNPAKTLGFKVNYIKGDMISLPFNDNSFDRIFCISVLEHLSKEDILKAAKEFNRILKIEGLIILTVDCWGTGLLWQDFIQASGLSLFGESAFGPPPTGKHAYEVVGFVLRKE